MMGRRAVLSSSKTCMQQQLYRMNAALLVNKNQFQTRDIRFVTTRNDEEAKHNAIRLYRSFLKLIPWMKNVYHIPTEQSLMLKRIKREFLKNAEVKDRALIDVLVFRGLQEYEEVEMHHKQRGHVLRFFAEEEPAMMNPKYSLISSLGSIDLTKPSTELPEHITEYLKDHPDILERFRQLTK